MKPQINVGKTMGAPPGQMTKQQATVNPELYKQTGSLERRAAFAGKGDFNAYQDGAEKNRQQQNYGQQNYAQNQNQNTRGQFDQVRDDRQQPSFDKSYDRDQKYQGQNQKQGFDDKKGYNSGVWDECAKYIKRQLPGIIELKKFFEPYDISDDRVFEKWELQEIFPFINERDLSDISHGYAQQGKQRLFGDQICDYWFISDQIEQTRQIAVLTRSLPKDQGIYDKNVQSNVKELLLEIIKINPRDYKQTFENLFGFMDQNRKPIFQVSTKELQLAFENKLKQRRDPRDFIALNDYFNPLDKKSGFFSKIMFVRGLQSFQQNYDYQGNPLRPPMDRTQKPQIDSGYQQPYRGYPDYQQDRYPPRREDRNNAYGRDYRQDDRDHWYDDHRDYDRDHWYDDHRHGHGRSGRDYPSHRHDRRDDSPRDHGRRSSGHRDTRGRDRRDDSREHGRRRSPSREYSPKGGHQNNNHYRGPQDKSQGQQDEKTLPSDIQVLIERISKYAISMKTRNLIDCLKLHADHIAGELRVKRLEFVQGVQQVTHEGLKMDEKEAERLADHYNFEKDGVKYVNIQEVQGAVFNQAEVFQKLVAAYSIQLQAIREQLKSRVTGVFKWFQQHAKNGKFVVEDDFNRAIENLGLIEITKETRCKIYHILDWDQNGEVPIFTIVNAFKFFDRQNKKFQVAPINEIIEKVMKAFNCDEVQLKSRLKALEKLNGLDLTDFVTYLTSLPRSTEYYTSDEIIALGENFVNEEKGMIELPEMLAKFLEVRLERNLVMNQYEKGIHEMAPFQQNLQNMPQQFNPTFNQLIPRVATQAAIMNARKPYDFRKTVEEYLTDQIVRALYCTKMTALQFFMQYVDYQTRKLAFSHFQTALGQLLGTMMQPYQLQQVFNAIAQYEKAVGMNAISPEKIDEFLHFSCEKNFQQLHDELLQQLHKAIGRNVSFAQILNLTNFNMNTQILTPDQVIMQIRQQLRLNQWIDTDYNFLILQYLHPTDPRIIQHTNLVQDVDKFSLQLGTLQPNPMWQSQTPQLGQSQNQFQTQLGSPQNMQQPISANQYQHPFQGTNVDQQYKERLIAQIVQSINAAGIRDFSRPFLQHQRVGARTLSSQHFKEELFKLDRYLNVKDCNFLADQYRDRTSFNSQYDEVEIQVFLEDIKNEKDKSLGASKTAQITRHRISKKNRDDHNFIMMIKEMDIKMNGQISDQIEQVFSAWYDQNKKTKINKDQLIYCLQNLRIHFNQMENREFENWWLQNAKHEGQFEQVDIVDLFRPLGLENVRLIKEQNKEGHKNRAKILDKDQLRECHLLCVQIKNDIVKSNFTVEKLLQNFGFIGEKTVDHQTFFTKLKSAPITPETRSKVTDKKIMSNLIYYLAREVKQRVSIQKLRFALDMRETDVPLKQECIDEERKIYERTMSSLYSGQVPAPARHFLHWLDEQQKEIPAFFNVASLPDIKRSIFESTLKQAGYVTENMQQLIESISVGANVSLKKLQDFRDLTSGLHKTVNSKVTDKKQAQERATIFEPSVQMNLKKLTSHLQSSRLTSDELFNQWDRDNSGDISKSEFISGIQSIKGLAITPKDAGQIFDAFDADLSGSLTRNEFNLYIEGTKMTIEQRRKNLSQQAVIDLKRQIFESFQRLDEDNSQTLDKEELQKAMKAVGRQITLEDAKKIISDATQGKKLMMNYQEFENFFLPMIIDKILVMEDSANEMRRIFKQADTDYSGFLSADELYGVMLKLKIEVSFHELVEMLSDFDCDGDAKLNIDEFVQLMIGDDLNCSSHQGTLNKIKQGGAGFKFDFAEILKEIAVMPSHFVKSFFDEEAKIRPSDCIRIQIDPKTYLYKDMLWNKSTSQTGASSYLQPFESLIGCEITLETAEGVPLPKDAKDQNSIIVRRAVRVGIFDKVKRKLTFNYAMVKAEWNEKEPGQWTFTHSQNPVLFRSIAEDGLDSKIDNYDLIFELVVFMKNKDKGDKITQYCCGWAEAPLNCAKKNITHKVDLKGGSPYQSSDIDSKDVVQEKGFIKSVLGLNQTNKSRISIKFASKEKWPKDVKTLIDLLPSTCFVNRNLLSFIVAYREYAASVLKVAGNDVPYSKPSGDVVLRCLPEILDNPDIAEILTGIWVEDYVTPNKEKDPIKALVSYKDGMAKVIKKLWPVLFSDEMNEPNPVRPKGVTPQDNLSRLIQSALRYETGQTGSKKNKTIAPPEQLTYFKPFNIRELEVDVWDGHERIYDPAI